MWRRTARGRGRSARRRSAKGQCSKAMGSARKQLNWRLYGLTFVDSGAFDPASPNSVYSGSKRFALDYSQPARTRMVVCGLHTRPLRLSGRPIISSDARRAWRADDAANQRQALICTHSIPYAHYLSVYRFDTAHGEVAIPSGLLARKSHPRAPGRLGSRRTGEWMWRDSNGDGVVDANEITSNPSTGSTVGDGFWWVDTPGNVWLATPTSGIREMPLARSGFVRQSDLPVRESKDVSDAAAVHAARSHRL